MLFVLEKSIDEEDLYVVPKNEDNVDKEIRVARIDVRVKQEEAALDLIQRRFDNKQFK